jgi:hypothetical protein
MPSSMVGRRKTLKLGGSAVLAAFAGCSSTESSTTPSENTPGPEAAEEGTPTEENTPGGVLDLGFPVNELETVEVKKWNEIFGTHPEREFVTDDAVYATIEGNVDFGSTEGKVVKIPYSSGEPEWVVEKKGEVVIRPDQTYVRTDGTEKQGIYKAPSGEQLFSVPVGLRSPMFVPDGVWYIEPQYAHKFDYEGERVDKIFTTNYNVFNDGTVDADNGIMYLPSAGGLFGIDISKSNTNQAKYPIQIGTTNEKDEISEDLNNGVFTLTDELGVYRADGTAVAFDRGTQSVVSKFSFAGKPDRTTVANGKLIANKNLDGGVVEAFDLRNNEKLWTVEDDIGSVVVYNGYLLGILNKKVEDRKVGVRDLESGERVTNIDISDTDAPLERLLQRVAVYNDELVIFTGRGYKRIAGSTQIDVEG